MTPKAETLDAICVLITGDDEAKFDRVKTPEQRVEIVKMALAAERNELLDAIDDRLAVVSNWFDKSKVYWP